MGVHIIIGHPQGYLGPRLHERDRVPFGASEGGGAAR